MTYELSNIKTLLFWDYKKNLNNKKIKSIFPLITHKSWCGTYFLLKNNFLLSIIIVFFNFIISFFSFTPNPWLPLRPVVISHRQYCFFFFLLLKKKLSYSWNIIIIIIITKKKKIPKKRRWLVRVDRQTYFINCNIITKYLIKSDRWNPRS